MERTSQRADAYEPGESSAAIDGTVAPSEASTSTLAPPLAVQSVASALAVRARRKLLAGRPRAVAANDTQRCLLADYCHTVLYARAGVDKPALLRPAKPSIEARLTPRMIETMNHLLKGDGEKQIAMKLGISRHTVHVYIKQIYRRYNVNSKGELFADWVRRGGPLAKHPS